MLLRVIALCAFVPGCLLESLIPEDDTLPQCDVTDASDVMLVASDGQQVFDIADGAQVPLIGAPQGGHILLVGARVRTADSCQLTANAALRDKTTQRVLGLEERPLLLDERFDGWAVPRTTLDAMPNVAVCPSSAATVDIHGNDYALEVKLMKGAMVIANLTASVTPTCNPAAAQYCQSDCSVIP